MYAGSKANDYTKIFNITLQPHDLLVKIHATNNGNAIMGWQNSKQIDHENVFPDYFPLKLLQYGKEGQLAQLTINGKTYCLRFEQKAHTNDQPQLFEEKVSEVLSKPARDWTSFEETTTEVPLLIQKQVYTRDPYNNKIYDGPLAYKPPMPSKTLLFLKNCMQACFTKYTTSHTFALGFGATLAYLVKPVLFSTFFKYALQFATMSRK